MDNCYDEAVINAGFGLGEAIVSGVVTPDSYVVDKVAKTILNKDVQEKTLALQLRADGGIEEVRPADPVEQALTDEQILELAELIDRVEAHYEQPMDIEWAFEAGTLYLLQARPITTHFPLFPELLTEPGEQKRLYTDLIGATQGFSESMSVLGLDLWAIVMDRLGGQGSMPAGEGGLMINLHGRQYVNAGSLVKAWGKKAAHGLLNHFNPAMGEHWKELLPPYVPPKKTPLMKSAGRALIKVGLGYLGPSIRMLLTKPERAAREYDDLVEETIASIRGLENDRPFDEMIEAGWETMSGLWAGWGPTLWDFWPCAGSTGCSRAGASRTSCLPWAQR